MLGVRRATVNVATGMVKKAGSIRYVRGKITITDRPGLGSARVRLLSSHRQGYASLRPAIRKERPEP